LGFNVLFSILFASTLSLYFSLNVINQVSFLIFLLFWNSDLALQKAWLKERYN
jgi:hypothetical protein